MTALETRLRKLDPAVHSLKANNGIVYLAPGLQGRIFCAFGEEMVSKLDFPLAENPTPGFNNIGGNSLWPAPEGGNFAYNYPDGEWTVQDGINKVPAKITSCDENGCVMEKAITLKNAKGVNVDLAYERVTKVVDASSLAQAYSVEALSYTSLDSFTALGDYSVEDVLCSAWTLEQFPGSDGITGFGKFGKKGASAKEVINDDFYGDPLKRIRFTEDLFIFSLGGPERLQIGFKKDCSPEYLGAWDAKRNILIIRHTPPVEGKYINIADNEQKNGPYSTEDMYSIFNGAELNFFELETIAPMNVEDGLFRSSVLYSQTWIFRGDRENLAALLEKQYKINAKEIFA